MSYVILRTFNAIRAKDFGYKLTRTDRLILRRSPLHIHTELQFSPRHQNISFSNTMRDGNVGARFKNITYSHPEYWDSIVIQVTDAQEDKMVKKARTLVGQKYDLCGLLSFASPLSIIVPSGNKSWCCEVCWTVLNEVFGDLGVDPHKTQPTYSDYIARYYFEQNNNSIILKANTSAKNI